VTRPTSPPRGSGTVFGIRIAGPFRPYRLGKASIALRAMDAAPYSWIIRKSWDEAELRAVVLTGIFFSIQLAVRAIDTVVSGS